MFPPKDERGEKTPTQLGPLERANLNHWIFWDITPCSHLKVKREMEDGGDIILRSIG
jgi:hypothetical protein